MKYKLFSKIKQFSKENHMSDFLWSAMFSFIIAVFNVAIGEIDTGVIMMVLCLVLIIANEVAKLGMKLRNLKHELYLFYLNPNSFEDDYNNLIKFAKDGWDIKNSIDLPDGRIVILLSRLSSES